MTVLFLCLLAASTGAGIVIARRRVTSARALGDRAQRIVFPFLGTTLSEPALEAALRLARSEDAVLVPVYLAEMPRRLALDAPLERRADGAMALLEAIELRAARCSVPVDARIERGRTLRHACRELIEHERFDHMLVAAAGAGAPDGLSPDDIAWLMRSAPGEIIVIRPAPKAGAVVRPRSA